MTSGVVSGWFHHMDLKTKNCCWHGHTLQPFYPILKQHLLKNSFNPKNPDIWKVCFFLKDPQKNHPCVTQGFSTLPLEGVLWLLGKHVFFCVCIYLCIFILIYIYIYLYMYIYFNINEKKKYIYLYLSPGSSSRDPFLFQENPSLVIAPRIWGLRIICRNSPESSLRSNLWTHDFLSCWPLTRWPGSSLPWWNRSGGRS